MIRNIVLVSLRNLLQNRSYAVLHILGLTLGITCSLFIALYVIDETGYDSFHAKKDRIYRIITTITDNGSANHYPTVQIPMGKELQNYPAIERAVRFIEVGRELFEVPDLNQKFYEDKVLYADPSVFEVFSFPLISGDARTALVERSSAVVTKTTAQKFFGTSEAIGKVFVSKGKTYTVTGVMDDLPSNSSINFVALLSMESFPRANEPSWDAWYPDTYVLLAEKGTAADIALALEKIKKKHVDPVFSNSGIKISYWSQVITDQHLRSGYEAEGGDLIEYVYIFISIAVFVVIIACINYINLATARASRRAKEIGIRKTIGSTKANIMMQFMAESMMLTGVSLIISLILTFILLPYFNELAGKAIGITFIMQPAVIATAIGLLLLIGVAGGAYPALYLSSFNPALVLKGNVSRGSANKNLRKTLVSVQFAISIAMIICTSIVYDQLSFMRNQDLGFDRDQVIYLEMGDSALMNSQLIMYQKLKEHSQIVDVAASSSMPGMGINYIVMRADTEEGVVSQGIFSYFIDFDFAQTMGLTIVDGRNLSREFAADSSGALVNEEMVRSMKWKEPIGKRFFQDDNNPETNDKFYTVVGVVKDFHQSSLHSPIGPLAFFRDKPTFYLNIKVKTNDLHSTIGFIEETWREVTNGRPFNYNFLDDAFERQYAADEKRGQIFTVFSIACLLISCVGLFGLAAYTTEQRAKEIGIRKVVGASVPTIVKLFYSDFLKLVAIGTIIAFPASYFAMDSWMDSFAFQAGMNWINFILSAAVTIIITMGSISFYAIRAASINPATTLKSE